MTSIATYHKPPSPRLAAQFFDQNAAGGLALLTCEDWNGSVYPRNVVVVALSMA